MKFRPILFSVFLAAFSAAALAQANIDPNQLALKLSTANASSEAAVPASFIAAIQSFEHQAFQLLNAKRIDLGLSQLTWNDDVAKVARLHSRNMADHKFFSHKDLDGKMVDDRADSLGLGEWRAIGENIAFLRGFKNPVESAVESWMQSTAHRQNLLNDRWDQSAVGVAIGDDGSYYFTQVFMVR